MTRGPSVRTRLTALTKRLGSHCPGCAGRPPVDACLFRYHGVLMTARGEPVDESVLRPCPVCGKGGVARMIDGVDPGLLLGVRVIAGVDPTSV